MNEIVDTVENLLENEFGLEVAHDRMRLPSVASEVALAVDAALQRAGLYNQKIHVLSEMNKTIACSVDKARAELGYRPSVELARACAARSLVPGERPGHLDDGDAAARCPPAAGCARRGSCSRTMRPRQWLKNVFVLGGLLFSGEFLDPAGRSRRRWWSSGRSAWRAAPPTS